jgi:hypothetical protein
MSGAPSALRSLPSRSSSAGGTGVSAARSFCQNGAGANHNRPSARASTAHGSQRGRGRRSSCARARSSQALVATSVNCAGIVAGSSQRVAAPATSRPTIANEASCCSPLTPEA